MLSSATGSSKSPRPQMHCFNLNVLFSPRALLRSHEAQNEKTIERKVGKPFLPSGNNNEEQK